MATAEERVAWAHRILPTKNTLTAADARIVEEAFAAKINAFAYDPARADGFQQDTASLVETKNPSADADLRALKLESTLKIQEAKDSGRAISTKVEKDTGALALGKPHRKRDKAHREFVSSQPCLVCGRQPSDAHHLRFAQARALGRKVSDEFTVPLCRVHHRDLHRRGNEVTWWENVKIDPVPIAQKLWRETH